MPTRPAQQDALPRSHIVALVAATRSAATPTAFSSDAELAQWLGINPNLLARYRNGHRPRGQTAWRLIGLDAVLAALEQVFDPRVIPDWLLGVNAHLGDQRPLDVLREGHVAEVMSAVEAERTGSFA